jgi:hypothetical protein
LIARTAKPRMMNVVPSQFRTFGSLWFELFRAFCRFPIKDQRKSGAEREPGPGRISKLSAQNAMLAQLRALREAESGAYRRLGEFRDG